MERRSIAVRGIVQGVGFRPFVHGLAGQLGLRGSVRNRAGEVLIEVEGAPSALDRFLERIAGSPPRLARIEDLTWTVESEQRSCLDELRSGEARFRIEPSDTAATGALGISPDVATCEHCLAELHDPIDRRYRYPFLNCTQCGPRLTIALAMPYDRERTTLATFMLCPECRTEYESPEDRRFHAQPIACPACGPQLRWRSTDGDRTADALAAAARTIAAGGLVAIKGVGGFHLACDAAHEAAVERLRAGKERSEKPFALMVPDLATARRLCELDAAAERLLAAPERPVVLLPRRPDAAVAPGVAPGGALLGLLLPYSPLHELLMEQLGRTIVLTSGNRGGEPMAIADDEAVAGLGGLADGFLTHDRPIAVRCDDSVVRWTGRRMIPIRRSRGWAPRPVKVGRTGRPVLALGGHEKNTFCLLQEGRATLSHHIGDLDTVEAIRDLRSALSHYQRLLDFTPQAVACDLHPDYASTGLARELAAGRGLPLVQVQHHHAHVLSVLAEHELAGPALGIVLDGSGLGTDGTVWGFEFLEVDGGRMARLGHLEQVRLPGGEAAVREPWRMALAWLLQAWNGELPALDLPVLAAEPRARHAVERLVARGIQAPLASSAGRLFDAVAALLDLRRCVSFEGQAAMALEALAAAGPARPYPFALEPTADGFLLRFSPAVRALAEEAAAGGDPGWIAARFHRTLVDSLVAGAHRAREERGLERVVLAGGCFQNALLLDGAHGALAAAGFAVLVPSSVPPNDGGLALGQAVAAAAEELPPCA